MSSICPWPCLASMDTTVATAAKPHDSVRSRQKQLPSSSKNLAAAIKSVKILSKFWGDEVDEEPATDSDTDIESNRSLFESHSNIDKYLAKNVELASTTKPGRKSKSTKILEGTSSIRITRGSDDDKDNK